MLTRRAFFAGLRTAVVGAAALPLVGAAAKAKPRLPKMTVGRWEGFRFIERARPLQREWEAQREGDRVFFGGRQWPASLRQRLQRELNAELHRRTDAVVFNVLNRSTPLLP